MLDARAPRTQHFFFQTTDGQHAARQGDLAGHADIVTRGHTGQGADHPVKRLAKVRAKAGGERHLETGQRIDNQPFRADSHDGIQDFFISLPSLSEHDTRVRARPFVKGGFKMYASDSVFFSTEWKFGLGDGVQHALWKTGFGVDF